MTYEERQQYNRLPYGDQKEYDLIKEKHPYWDHERIMKKVAFDHKLEDIMENRGDLNPEDPTLLKEILEGAKQFLIGVGIFIEGVFTAIDNALNALTDLIYRGVTYLGDKLSEFWEWLTS